jgi:hypothetical protein
VRYGHRTPHIRRRLSLALLPLVAVGFSATSTRVSASTPPSQNVTVPTAGSVTITWTGTIPAGSNHGNSTCATVPSDPTVDNHSVVVSVPAGLYNTSTATFAFSITWTPSSGNENINDEVLTLVGPSGEIASSDGSTTTEAVSEQNLPAATYDAEACGFVNSAPQNYDGKLVITTASNPSAPPTPTPPANPITFGVPAVMDPIHTFGEPSIGVSRLGNVFASGPTGTGTQRSAWEVSKDAGDTYRVINQMTPPNAIQSINAPPGGGDTDLAFDNQSPQNHYFSDLYALACLRNEKTSDEGATTTEGFRGCANNLPEVDRQWFAVWDPPAGVTTTSLNLVRPTVYQEYGPAPSTWVKSPDGINYTSADGGNGHFGADGYPSIDQVTGKVFEATYSGSTIKLNIGTPNDMTGDLTFLDDTGGPGLITVASGVANSGDVANFVVSSMDSARNLYVAWVGRSSTPTLRQVFVAASSPTTGWTQWTTPVQVSDGLGSTGDQVNVFPWIKAGGPGMADAVWYGDSSNLDPSSTSPGHVWNVFMNQVAFPTNPDGTINYNAPSTQLVKVSPHPMDYEDICLSGTGCITNMPPGNRNLADFFEVNIDHTGAAEIIYDDMSNGLIQQPFATSNPADHAGAALVTVARQNGGTGLFGTLVNGPSASPVSGQKDSPGDALWSLNSGAVTGSNHTSLDFLSNQLSLSGSTLTVTMKVADLSAATVAADSADITGDVHQQYVTRWQMGNTIYYAMMETTAAQRAASADTYFAGAAQSIDLCSVSACDPHVLYYPEAGTTAHVESGGSVSCPPTPSASTPCTITIPVSLGDVGSPSSSSLLEEVGSYAFASSHLQSDIDNAQAQADNVPLEVDGICCFNFQANNLSTNVPEFPWAPGLGVFGVALIATGIAARRRRRRPAITTMDPS